MLGIVTEIKEVDAHVKSAVAEIASELVSEDCGRREATGRVLRYYYASFKASDKYPAAKAASRDEFEVLERLGGVRVPVAIPTAADWNAISRRDGPGFEPYQYSKAESERLQQRDLLLAMTANQVVPLLDWLNEERRTLIEERVGYSE